MIKIYLQIAFSAVVMGTLAMLAIYILVLRGPENLREFKDHCTNQLQGTIVETVNGISCHFNQEEVLDYE